MEVNFNERLSPEVHRKERIAWLRRYYLTNLVEDPIDGTMFDCEILDFLRDMEEKHKNDRGLR
jgi:hypothetical protein